MLVFSTRKAGRAVRRAAIHGLLAVYLFALVFLPAMHVHGTCCPPTETVCGCGHTEENAALTSADECGLCRILHTTVPLSDFTLPIVDRPVEVPRPSPILSVFQAAEAFGIPSSRAPPFSTES